jgi:cobaltochelatase CobN
MVVVFTNHNDSKEPDIRLVFISVANRDSVHIGKMAEMLGDVGTKMEIMCADSEDVDQSEEEFVKLQSFIRTCDFLFFKFHGDPSFFLKYDRIRKIIDSKNIDTFFDSALDEVNEENRCLFRHTDEDYLLIRLYLDMGGRENYSSMLKWACRNIAGDENVDVPMPAVNRVQGIYRKGSEADIEIEEYIKGFDWSRPTIGVMMHYTSYSKERCTAINDLIEKLTELRCNVIPLYFNSYPNDITGSLGVKRTVEKYFMMNGRVLVNAVVLTTGFSQISLSDPNAVNEGRTIHNFFEDLNVPIIQAPTISRSPVVWADDEVGMTATELSTGVIWPEFDGQIISVPLLFNESLGDGRYKNTSVPDRVDKIADLAKEWAELRMKEPKDSKIAILFHMYPPTNDRLGGAAGLDTFESVCGCLKAMEKEGYAIERVPENGKEILDELLAGLTTDLEWTPENEIEERAADMLGPAEYQKWYEELTEKAKDGIVRSWGQPPGDMMVHDGRIIIPGVMNGNVFVGMQPNRGQHELAEKLYHDPYVVMPHAYLAYYRWLKHVFKANCIIHVGTHGTIEWLPGKGNALSSSCYPDINIDTIPNVYPYIVDDPGEGIQCKRRIDSVLIGHMCPAMTRADGYDDIALLDGKLQEYLNSETTSQDEKVSYLVDEI